jgi:hypothetical protein
LGIHHRPYGQLAPLTWLSHMLDVEVFGMSALVTISQASPDG